MAGDSAARHVRQVSAEVRVVTCRRCCWTRRTFATRARSEFAKYKLLHRRLRKVKDLL